MARNWKRALKKDPRVVQPRLLRLARMRQLANDNQFLVETARLKRKCEQGLSTNPKAIKRFFRKYSDPTIFPYGLLQEFLDGTKNSHLRSLYKNYFTYAFRFGAFFNLKAKEHRPFKVAVVIPRGSKFHVRLVGNSLRPGGTYPGLDEPYDYFFESDEVEVSPQLQKLIASGSAKFVRIDDESWSSILSKLERFSYDPEKITFLIHNAEQPYLFCLVGEKVETKDWRTASKAVIAFLQEHYRRGTRGRRVNIQRFRKALRLQKEPGPLKLKAEKLQRGELAKDVQSAQAYAIRVGKLLD